jgi:hypothetical protein
MCTVTFVPDRGTVFLTSSRDEKKTRKAALYPELYPGNGGALLYPKDGDAGGTWIAAHENGNAGVLLNGAKAPHLPLPPYRQSRGMILLEIMQAQLPSAHFSHTSFEGIEPFTLILIENKRLLHCWWDGEVKEAQALPNDRPHIWSSTTLYDATAIQKRDRWFRDWLQNHPAPGLEEIMGFHLKGGVGDPSIDIRMDREGEVSTVSISSIFIGEKEMKMHYTDLRAGQRMHRSLPYSSIPNRTI